MAGRPKRRVAAATPGLQAGESKSGYLPPGAKGFVDAKENYKGYGKDPQRVLTGSLSRGNGRGRPKGYTGSVNEYADAKTEEARLRAERLRQIMDRESGSSLEVARAVPAFARLLNSLKTSILGAAAACAQEANPEKPALAKAVILKYVKDVFISYDESEVRRVISEVD